MSLSHLCLDNLNDQMFLIDRHGHIININESACRFLGYNRKELLLMDFFDIDTMLTSEIFEQHWEELKISQTLRFESEHRKKNGSLWIVDITSHFIKLDTQEYICLVVKIPTDNNGYLSQLQETNEEFNRLFEHMSVGVARALINGQFLQVNDAFCQLLGYSREEILVKSISLQQIAFPDELDQMVMLYRQLLAGEIPSFSVEKHCVNKNGAITWVSLSISLLRDKHDNPLYLIASAVDINVHKQQPESEDLLVTLFEQAKDGIVIIDLEGRIQRVNTAYLKLSGYAESDLLGHTLTVLKSELHSPAFRARLWSSLKSIGYWRGSILNRHKNGEIHQHLLTINALTSSLSEATRYVVVFSNPRLLKKSKYPSNLQTPHGFSSGWMSELITRQTSKNPCRQRNRQSITNAVPIKVANHQRGQAIAKKMLNKQAALQISNRARTRSFSLRKER